MSDESQAQANDIYCPQCEYALVQLEEHGISQCPECGARLDFDELRQWRMCGQPLGSDKDLMASLTKRRRQFFEGLLAPRYYLNLDRRRNNVVRGLVYGSLALTFIGFMEIALRKNAHVEAGWPGYKALLIGCAWAVAMLLLLFLSKWWLIGALRLAGHDEPRPAAKRIMFFAGAFLESMSWSVVAFAAVMMAGSRLFVSEAPGPSCESVIVWPTIILTTCICYVISWLRWTSTIFWAFRAETRALSSYPVLLAMANPIALAHLGPMLALVGWMLL